MRGEARFRLTIKQDGLESEALYAPGDLKDNVSVCLCARPRPAEKKDDVSSFIEIIKNVRIVLWYSQSDIYVRNQLVLALEREGLQVKKKVEVDVSTIKKITMDACNMLRRSSHYCR